MSSIAKGICTIEECEKKIECRGMCHKHYVAFIRSNGSKVNKGGICSIEGCDRKLKSKGYCNSHYMRIVHRGGGPDRIYENHNMRHTPEYEIWCSMKQRCNNPNSTGYADYGGRGIKLAREWQNSFMAFYNYIGSRPSDEYSIDRIDVNGNYEPGNVIWATKSVQGHNQRVRGTNTSGYKGVSWRKDIKKWTSAITSNGHRTYLGLFDTPEEASRAYEKAEVELFARTEHIAILKNETKPSISSNNRILKKIKKGKNDEACWEWIGYITNKGYGLVHYNGATRTAHNIVYEILVGEIPGSMQLHHECHNRDKACKGGPDCLHRRCVNPSHLRLVTPLENLKLDNTISTVNATKTHCDRGHPLKGANLRISYASGSKVRFCKQCDKIRNERHKVKRRKIMEAGGQNVDPRTLGKTHCKNGHELTDEIIKYGTRGYYYCILCDKAKQERRKARHHEKMLAEGREIRSGPKLKTHCIHGHPFDEANTYISPSDGRRHCRICLARIAREDRAKKKTQSKT